MTGNDSLAPAGRYLPFATDNHGIPTVAQWIHSIPGGKMNRHRIVATIAAGSTCALVGVLGGPLAASAVAPKPSVVHPADNTNFELKARQTSYGQSSSTLKPGVRFWQTEALKLNGKRVGTSVISGTIVIANSNSVIAEVEETFDFGALQAGTIQAAGDVDLSPGADDALLAITGGTSDGFTGAQGQVDVSFDSDTATTYDFDFINN